LDEGFAEELWAVVGTQHLWKAHADCGFFPRLPELA
jgi:hypothetical protein